MRNYLLLCLLILTAVSKSSHATAWGTDCSYDTKIFNITIPSGQKISIDPNAPVGTVFYEYHVPAKSGLNFKCQTPASYYTREGYVYGVGGQTVAMSGAGLVSQNGSTYQVYKTNVPGVGLVAWFGGNAFPYWWGKNSIFTNIILDYTNSIAMEFDIDIIKYGDIPAGAGTIKIDSTVISSINWTSRISNSSNTSRLPNGEITLARFVFSSSTFDIVTGTCDTPDVAVSLGNHVLGNSSNREGGKFATPWIDASIRLTNCPVFYGTGGRSNKNSVRNNVMTVTLVPNNVTTSSQGIMPVDTGSSAATGMGIQLAYGTAASPQLVDFSAGKGTKTYTMSSTQGSAYTIPLVARYLQTASNISNIGAGNANGKVTYLIDYH